VKVVSLNPKEMRGLYEAAREIRLPLFFALGFVLLCGLILLVFWDDSDVITRSYHALSLGMDMDTVDYVAGKPAQISAGDRFKDYALEKQADKNFTAHDFKIWKYADGLTVVFNADNRLVKVSCSSTMQGPPCEPLFGFKIGDAEDLLLAKLGEAYESKIEDGIKIIYYPALNARFDLHKRKIMSLELTDSSELIRK
jgi:hypothetical protein